MSKTVPRRDWSDIICLSKVARCPKVLHCFWQERFAESVLVTVTLNESVSVLQIELYVVILSEHPADEDSTQGVKGQDE